MQIGQKITEVFEKNKVEELLAVFGDVYASDVDYLLLRNGNTIPIRRQINDYYTFVVSDDKAENVIIKKSSNPYGATCSCKVFQVNDVCPHIIAVLKSIIDQIDADVVPIKDEIIDTVSDTSKEMSESVVDQTMPFIVSDASDMSFGKMVRQFPFIQGMQLPSKTVVNNIENGKQVVCRNHTEKFFIDTTVNKENDVIVSCSCKQTYKGKLCDHARFALAYISYQFNKNLFTPYLNQDREKNKILADFGLSINDLEAKEFEFGLDKEGQVVLIKAPARFKSFRSIDKLRHVIEHAGIKKSTSRKRQRFVEDFDANHIGICFCMSDEPRTNVPIYIEAYKLEANKRLTSKVTRIPVSNNASISILSNLDDAKFEALMQFSFETYKYHLRSEVTFTQHSHFEQKFTPELRQAYIDYFYAQVYEHWDTLASWPKKNFLFEKRTFHLSNFEPLELSDVIVTPEISISESDKFIEIAINFKKGSEIHPAADVSVWNGRIIKIGNTIYRHDKPQMYTLLEMIEDGHMLFPQSQRSVVMQEVIMPLVRSFDLTLPEEFSVDVESFDMSPVILLKEVQDKYLSIQPMFAYDDIIVPWNYKKSASTFHDNHQARYISRDILAEEEFYEYLRSQHTNWKGTIHDPALQLPFDEVMKNNWFVSFTQSMMDKGVKIEGMDKLHKFKFNTSTPKWEMSISSGIDWFDLNITASWGDQVLGYKELRKAIASGQNFVVLPDGSLGVLPDEWATKYGLILKLSKDDGENGGRISKKQFGIVDMLYAEIDDADVRRELDEKKQNLYELDNFNPAPIPTQISATLRPYQESGYQWMQMLDKVSWGGCLADDMGLGKTLQAITFLQFIKNKYDSPTSIVICPTSLIYNWQLEFEKFAPELKYYVYYGLGRTNEELKFSDYDVVITSYGVARNDVESLMDAGWEYIILDESQTIKNPDAGITKAMMLYKARNRFILSGTPMQNNTFDLYAQFNFLNSGIFGSKDFFRNEFATQIDRNSNKDVAVLLKRMIKPFMLRRTKGEVAIDLPEKTESVIWCEMDADQRQIYDTYKDFYRGALTQRIATEGLAKSGVYILEGLLRLRQICDDPRLIKTDGESTHGKGVKIRELVREIKENIGDHKILVFSQFTEMLSLIRQDLDHDNINYAYLDGSTQIQKRKTQIEDFQNNEDIKIFLISLKAGGVGLNLTAADYVYIVDPWWNPAVEQQAIDRAHRIGQKNNIFAYKMICKGTVEEKILTLQEKKLGIARDIVGEDNAFFKKLTVDDIQYLFS